MSEIENRLQKQCSAASDFSLVISLKLVPCPSQGADNSILENHKHCYMTSLSSSKDSLLGTYPHEPALNISPLFPSDMLQVQVYEQVFDSFLSNFQSLEQRLLKQLNPGSVKSITYPGTDSNCWRCIALGYLRSRDGLAITILLTLFVHQKIEGVNNSVQS